MSKQTVSYSFSVPKVKKFAELSYISVIVLYVLFGFVSMFADSAGLAVLVFIFSLVVFVPYICLAAFALVKSRKPNASALRWAYVSSLLNSLGVVIIVLYIVSLIMLRVEGY